MNNIIFENVVIKPSKSGYYKCPFNCHDSRYPQPKWKTEKGFMKHLEKCNMKPSVVSQCEMKKQEIDNQINEWKEILDELKPIILSNLGLNIGDEICFIKCIIVKDTHEQRYNRMVRVRYEPILRYEAVRTTITSINFIIPYQLPTIENTINLVYLNQGIKVRDLIKWEDAQVKAKEMTEADKKYREECSSYR